MSAVINGVDDYGTKCGIVSINSEKTLVFEDTDGFWRKVCDADSRHEQYHDFLRREGREHGQAVGAPRIKQNA